MSEKFILYTFILFCLGDLVTPIGELEIQSVSSLCIGGLRRFTNMVAPYQAL